MASIIEEVEHIPWLLSPLRKSIDNLTVAIERFSPDDESSWDQICLKVRSAYNRSVAIFTVFEGVRERLALQIVDDSIKELWERLKTARQTLPFDSRHFISVSAKITDLANYARDKFNIHLT